MELAPIILFVYKRPDHTLKVLEALQNNVLASDSVLYIYCDGPKMEADPGTINAIEKTRQILRSKNWCKEVHIIERQNNWGLEKSVIEGVTEIVNKHGKIIVLEDDIITSRFFLQFMNDALNVYANEHKVISIGALNFFAVDDEVDDTFFIPIPDCWGWATWKDRWELFEPNAQLLLNKLREKNLIDKFNLEGSYNFESMLIDQVKGNISSWAIRWQAVAYTENKLTLYPKYSVTKNIGFDKSGTHGGDDRYSKNIRFAEKRIPVGKREVAENSSIIKKMNDGYFQITQPANKAKTKKLIRKYIKYLTPPAISLLYRGIKPRVSNGMWDGDFSSWADASANCSGYENTSILEKTKSAILKVKNGFAAAERDSVLFENAQYNWKLITYLLKFAVENNNQLSIIDFGGSLGSSYFQNRELIPANIRLSWNVVEQPTYIEVGNSEVADDKLHFFYSIHEALKQTNAEILLLSSVLQYLENPYSFLDEAINYGFEYIIIDRTAFIDKHHDRLTIQSVPASIYKASYPSWFFSSMRFEEYINNHYDTILKFKSEIDADVDLDDHTKAYWSGYILKRKLVKTQY